MEETTALALLHRGKLQRIHDAPPDSTTGLLQHVRMLSAASGKNWKNMELDKRGKTNKTNNIKEFLRAPSSSSLNIRQWPCQLTPASRPHRDLPRSAKVFHNSDSPAQAHGAAVSQWCWWSMLLVGSWGIVRIYEYYFIQYYHVLSYHILSYLIIFYPAHSGLVNLLFYPARTPLIYFGFVILWMHVSATFLNWIVVWI